MFTGAYWMIERERSIVGNKFFAILYRDKRYKLVIDQILNGFAKIATVGLVHKSQSSIWDITTN